MIATAWSWWPLLVNLILVIIIYVCSEKMEYPPDRFPSKYPCLYMFVELAPASLLFHLLIKLVVLILFYS